MRAALEAPSRHPPGAPARSAGLETALRRLRAWRARRRPKRPRPTGRGRLPSPLLRRILLVNALPLVLLVATLMYLGQYQNGLLSGEVVALREQARIYAGALGQSAVRVPEGHRHGAVLVADLARPLLRRLTEPTPSSVARLYSFDGQIIGDSNPDGVDGSGARHRSPPHARPSVSPNPIVWASRAYDALVSLLPVENDGGERVVNLPEDSDADELPDVSGRLRGRAPEQASPEFPPYIRRTRDHKMLITVSEPVLHDGRTVGIIELTRAAGEVDRSLDRVRRSILDLFLIALLLTVALSLYLARTIANPILQLARAATGMREGEGRRGTVPRALLDRADEIGALAAALQQSARALWARMDATERFAADVSHEIKNPLSSISSAIETIRRIDDHDKQRRLLEIISDDVSRLDRLISDISSASRVDAELSRASVKPVPVAPMLAALAEIHETTRGELAPRIRIAAPPGSGAADALAVLAVEDRLVQVMRNLIGNAISFSPAGGAILLSATGEGHMIAISVADEGPGIPEGKLEHIFERFYSERPTTERFGQHSGLGLSICRQIVEALHGRIGARNRLHPDGGIAGATFTVSLPRAHVTIEDREA